MTSRLAIACLLITVMTGCTVGPTYRGAPIAAPRAAAASRFLRAGDAPVAASPPTARWWLALGDPMLDTLEDKALGAFPNLDAARARLRQARASLREQKANLLPKGSASGLYAHARFPGLNLESQSSETSGQDSGGGGSSSIDLYNLGFDASWEVDLFGGRRRAVEAARATAEGAEADLADVLVSLTAEVAQAYANIRDRQHRIALNDRSVVLQARMLALTNQRYERGTASRLDVERLSQQLDVTRADATPLNAEHDAYLDELATLTGDEPGALDSAMATPGPLPLPPAQIAIGDPAGMLRRRPDIRAAERTLAADTAKIGQADAARFPSLSFMGIVGIGGTSPSDLTKLDDFTALLAPQLNWSFLDFGRNLAKVHQAEGVRDEAEAKYRSTVLAALRDAEDTLSRFRYRRITVATLARAKDSADATATLSHQRYVAGTTTMIDWLDAQRRQIAAEQDLSTAEVALTGDFVAIEKALGLGWSEDAGTPGRSVLPLPVKRY